ncbi:MAG: thioredoxin family protein [Candidatus Adiutrix sp.]|jgi:thioredoxin-related protein|nr:thioredoxin family protein [Candidatus Adiutrix sp.]
MKRLFLALCAALLFFLQSLSAQAAGLSFISYDQALKQAADEKKLVMVFFWADWCGYCRMLRQEVFSQDQVREVFERSFVGVSVDVQNDPEELSRKLRGSTALPTVTFLKSDGEPLGYFDGATDAETFIKILEYAAAKP